MDFEKNDVIKARIEKINELKKIEGIVYKNKFDKTGNINDILAKEEGEPVSAAGRVIAIREFGKLIFFHIQDFSGKIQIGIDSKTIGDERLSFFKKYVDIADFIGVTGKIIYTKTHEKTILAESFTLLTKAIRPLPEKWHGISDQEIKYRQRYLDLIMNPDSMKRFLNRSKLISVIRKFLEDNQFIEVETPILQSQKSGALAKPFITHHNALDIDLHLRISPETYLKRCIAGGFDRVYEFARSFRNEGMDPSHIQEFTLLEFYAAYWDYRRLMKFTEDLIKSVIQQMTGGLQIIYQGQKIDFSGQWPVYTFRELLINNANIDIDQYSTADELRKVIKSKGIVIEDIDKLGRGNLIDQLYKKVARPKMINPQFLINHPIDLSPLARKSDTNPLETDRFQLVVNTWEIINAYSELVDPIDQRQRFEQQALAHAAGDEDALEMDEDFCLCVDHGLPPIAGWGMGIDRFMALISDCENLKDVVLFPLMRPLDYKLSPEKDTDFSSSDNNKSEPDSDNNRKKFDSEVKKNIHYSISTESNPVAFRSDQISSDSTFMKAFPPLKPFPFDREEALNILKRYVKSDSLLKHSLASAAVMEGLAEYFNQDIDIWYITGLLHDLDFENVSFERHGLETEEILKSYNIDKNILHAIKAHNEEYTGVSRNNSFDIALTAAESITGLISATALIMPEKKVEFVKTESVIKRMAKKDFARNVNRDSIRLIEKIDLPLEKFVEIAMDSMKKYSSSLGI
jgi:lysyl-tRNA synthetase class 2